MDDPAITAADDAETRARFKGFFEDPASAFAPQYQRGGEQGEDEEVVGDDGDGRVHTQGAHGGYEAEDVAAESLGVAATTPPKSKNVFF